jgi:DNA segregation ATPase FtsK/SpoIIIE-like protein
VTPERASKGASDGASAAQELADTFAPPAGRAPSSNAPTASTPAPSVASSPFLVDEVFDPEIPLVSLDDVVIAADAPRRAPEPRAASIDAPVEAPRAEVPALPESSRTWEARVAAPDVAGLHGIGLDPLFRESVSAILNRGRASAVVLQSQLGIGYSRANRILDQMTEIGVTGPETPTGAREIRLPEEDLRRFLG